MKLRHRAWCTVVAGLIVVVYGLVELPFALRTPTTPVSVLLAMAVVACYTVFVAAPGTRGGLGMGRPMRHVPVWARVLWALALLAPVASLLVWPPTGTRQDPGPTGLPSLVAVYFGVSVALLSWGRLRELDLPEEEPAPNPYAHLRPRKRRPPRG